MTETERTSRRSMLTAGLAATAAAGVAMLGRPLLADAANGDTVTVGGQFSGTGTTVLNNTSGTGSGFLGKGGIYGVAGENTTGYGVYGYTTGDGGIGVYGNAGGAAGATIGVFGVAISPDGIGVRGLASQNVATQIGVEGESGNGIGVHAVSNQGTALRVDGKAKLSRSGVATAAAGKSYVDITVSGGLTSSSFIIATLQTRRTGVSISGVKLNYPSTGKARIYLSKVPSTTTGTRIGWLVLG